MSEDQLDWGWLHILEWNCTRTTWFWASPLPLVTPLTYLHLTHVGARGDLAPTFKTRLDKALRGALPKEELFPSLNSASFCWWNLICVCPVKTWSLWPLSSFPAYLPSLVSAVCLGNCSFAHSCLSAFGSGLLAECIGKGLGKAPPSKNPLTWPNSNLES